MPASRALDGARHGAALVHEIRGEPGSLCLRTWPSADIPQARPPNDAPSRLRCRGEFSQLADVAAVDPQLPTVAQRGDEFPGDCGLHNAEARALTMRAIRGPRTNRAHHHLFVRGKGDIEREIPIPAATYKGA